MSLSENSDDACVVCFKDVNIYSIGDCDHPVCYECSTRMRVLCRQNECPICRQDMPRVIFTLIVKQFRTINTNSYLQDKKFKICFENAEIQAEYNKLLEHICSLCPGRRAFQTFQYLKDHMRKEHDLQYCDLCVENLMIFTGERRSYTRQELAQHRRKGDPDDRSHRGHPLCEFCDQRYMDNDELYRHLRRDHLFCHFCDADGFHHYYSSYDDLRRHFRKEHYLCEEGACIEEKFTPVFRSEIDLKAHRASVHGRMLGKAAAKQNRTLELEFTLAPRPRERPRPRRAAKKAGKIEAEDKVNELSMPDEEDEGATGGNEDLEPSLFGGSRIDTDCIAQFPSLSGAAVPSSASSRPQRNGLTIRTSSRQPLAVTDENFPALGPEAMGSGGGGGGGGGGCKTVRLSVNRQDRPASGSSSNPATKAPTNVSIHVNHRPNSGGGQSIRIRPADNFPSLSRSKASENFPSLTRDDHRGGGKSQSEDFPSLSRGSSKAPAPAQWAAQSKPTPKPIPKPPPPRKPADDYPALSSRYAHKENGGPPVEEPVRPSAVVRPLEALRPKEVTLPDNTKTKSKKKKAKNGMLPEAKAVVKEGGDGGKKKKPAESSEGTKKKPVESSEGTKKTAEKVKGKSGKSAGAADEGRSEPSPASEPRVNGVVAERKRSELTIGSLETTTTADELARTLQFQGLADSFPPLGGGGRTNRPPPGFAAPKAPPPGFSVTLNSVARPPVNNDLTFTSSSGQSYSILPTSRQFVQPPDFARRNQNLITKVTECLKESDFNEFRQLSANFRQGAVSAWTFYDQCQETMGDAFAHIFPEMLVLLPDIDKQQELYAVSMNQPGRPGTFETCATCNQVLAPSDLRHHLTSHSLENHFPTLGRLEHTPGGAWVKK